MPNDKPPSYLPTPEEIQQAKLAIREEWKINPPNQEGGGRRKKLVDGKSVAVRCSRSGIKVALGNETTIRIYRESARE